MKTDSSIAGAVLMALSMAAAICLPHAARAQTQTQAMNLQEMRPLGPPSAYSGCKKPEYPMASLRYDEQGVVTFRFLIGVDGTVMQTEVVKSSGYPRLDLAALDALRKCVFKPGTENGQPVESWVPVQYVWTLR